MALKNPMDAPELDLVRRRLGGLVPHSYDVGMIKHWNLNKGTTRQLFFMHMGFTIIAERMLGRDLRKTPWANNPDMIKFAECIEACREPRKGGGRIRMQVGNEIVTENDQTYSDALNMYIMDPANNDFGYREKKDDKRFKDMYGFAKFYKIAMEYFDERKQFVQRIAPSGGGSKDTNSHAGGVPA